MSATNGWDAVCAMSLPQVNALMFQQYLRHGPTSPAMPMRLVFGVEQGLQVFWCILDAVLGPPELSFDAASQNATLVMELVRGSMITCDLFRGVVQNAIVIRPKESYLAGPLWLAKVDVTDTLGSLVVDLGVQSYGAKINGVVPDAVVDRALANGVQTYFANNETKFPIGTVAQAQVPASLQPTDFKFAVQQKPGSSDACVLLLIQTNGPGGTMQPLADYPIPDNHTAALLVSGQAVFGDLMVGYLNNGFAKLGTTFQATQNNGAWTVVGQGGEVDFGQVGNPDSTDHSPWSCQALPPGTDNEDGPKPTPAAVVIPLSGFTVQTTANGLSVSFGVQQPGGWSQYVGIAKHIGQVWNAAAATTQVTYSLQSQPVVDPFSDVVTFPGTGTLNVTQAGAPNWLQQLFGAYQIPNNILTGIQNVLQPVFGSFQLPSVDTFALTNLLFPADHNISLSQAVLTGDLNLTGTMVMPITVTPAQSNIAPGATVQFTAQAASDSDNKVIWEIVPRVGSISGSGLYTAPATIDEATVVVVTAVSQSDASKTGNAMVLVYESAAAQGVDVAPGTSLVTPGNSVNLSCADSNGKPLAVNWTLSPEDFGHIAPPLSPSAGQYIYTAPATISSATQVTITATNQANPTQTGSAVIQVIPTATVTVASSSTTVKFGKTVSLTATVSGGDPDNLAWAVYGEGTVIGTVVADPDDASKATYTAPGYTGGSGLSNTVLAYLVDGNSAGCGQAWLMLST